MNSDKVITLAKLGLEGNKQQLLDYIKSIAADSANTNKRSLYRGLFDLIEDYDLSQNVMTSGFQQIYSVYNIPDDLWFTRSLKRRVDRIVEMFKDDSLPQRYRARFNKILLYGPPGTGKTTIGFYLANELQRPIEYVKVSDVISFKFGETLKNIADVFNEHKDSIIFIDEFDAFAKSRFDSNDVGELKRVVNSLIQTLDVLSGDRIVIVATNLVESIDPAILRRFPIKLNVPELTKTERQDFLDFLIKTSDMKIKLSKDEKALLENAMQALGLKTIDAIKSLVDATLIGAHVQHKKSISLNDIFETMLTDGTLDSAGVKKVQETNVNLYNQILETLNAKLPKTEIAELMGVHRNSLNNYAKQV